MSYLKKLTNQEIYLIYTMVKTNEWKFFKQYAFQLILDNLSSSYDKNFLRGIKFLPEKFEEDLKNELERKSS